MFIVVSVFGITLPFDCITMLDLQSGSGGTLSLQRYFNPVKTAFANIRLFTSFSYRYTHVIVQVFGILVFLQRNPFDTLRPTQGLFSFACICKSHFGPLPNKISFELRNRGKNLKEELPVCRCRVKFRFA